MKCSGKAVLVCFAVIILVPASLSETVSTKSRLNRPIWRAKVELREIACLGCVRRAERVLQLHPAVEQIDMKFEWKERKALASFLYDREKAKLSELLKIIERETGNYRVLSDKYQDKAKKEVSSKRSVLVDAKKKSIDCCN